MNTYGRTLNSAAFIGPLCPGMSLVGFFSTSDLLAATFSSLRFRGVSSHAEAFTAPLAGGSPGSSSLAFVSSLFFCWSFALLVRASDERMASRADLAHSSGDWSAELLKRPRCLLSSSVKAASRALALKQPLRRRSAALLPFFAHTSQWNHYPPRYCQDRGR